MENIKKPKILIFCDFYLPGYKSGGGMRTIVNIVDRLHHRYEFWIVTRDHDGVLDTEQYTQVKINDWNLVGNARVFYLSKNNVRISTLRKIVLEVIPDLYYANSYFATLSIILVKLRKLRLIPFRNIIIAPCGELSDGSLRLKSAKKLAFTKFSKLSGLHKNINWKASSELEREEISNIKGSGGTIFISPDLPSKKLNEGFSIERKPEKSIGAAKMIFLSRFAPKKNFKWLLENLNTIKGNLVIDVVGPIEDQRYWEECVAIIDRLPKNIQVRSIGPIPYEETGDILLDYHFFILSTLSENFGHVFLEAMAAGCPLVISDRTPWLNLESRKLGWALPLENPDDWIKVINDCIAMSASEFVELSKSVRNFATDWLSDKKHEEDTINIFESSLQAAQSNRV